MLIRRLARPLLAAGFVARGITALRDPKIAADTVQPLLERSRETLPDDYARRVPTNTAQVVRATAAVQIGGGALLALGKAPRLASTALAASLIPSNIGAHPFWNESDPQRKATERAEFFADLGLLGGLLIAAVDTEGKPSLGWRGKRAAAKAADAVSSALPIGSASSSSTDSTGAERLEHGLHVAAAHGRTLAGAARAQGAHLADRVADRAPGIAEAARERGAQLAEIARERGPQLADATRERGAHLADVARERVPEIAEAARQRVDGVRQRIT